MISPRTFSVTLLTNFVFSLGFILSAQAQSIEAQSGNRSTNTQVTQTGNQFDITGGTFSGDGANQFHNFEQFGLTVDQVANFITNPATQNVVGSVLGGASYIDGTLQVSGSGANLYLLNPAGIVFGSNAELNLDGSFTAATSTGLGFNDNFFNAFTTQDYSQLTGDPSSFLFTETSAGSIVTAGDLRIDPGQQVTLVGGSVITTGTIETPDSGDITIAAVSGENQVRIRQEGMLLSIKLDTLPDDIAGASVQNGLVATDLPLLLTGAPETMGDLGVNVNESDTVSLTSSEVSLPTTTQGLNVVSGTLEASGETAGNIALLGNQVALVDATVDVSGDLGGGTVWVGGAYQGADVLPSAQSTYIDDVSTITADALTNGDGGTVIVWADQATHYFGDVSAQGGPNGGNGGFVEVSGAQSLTFNGSVNTFAPNGDMGTLLIDPTNITVISAEEVGDFTSLDQVDDLNDPNIGDNTISAALINNSSSNVQLRASENITFNANINITASEVGLDVDAGGNITTNNTIQTNGGDITFSADGDIEVNENIFSNRSLFSSGGDVTIIAGGSFTMDPEGVVPTPGNSNVGVRRIRAGGGDIEIAAKDDIVAGGIESVSSFNGINSGPGNVEIVSETGNVTVRYIRVEGPALVDGELDENPPAGGNIFITAEEGTFRATGVISSSSPVSVQTVGRLEDLGERLNNLKREQETLNDLEELSEEQQVRLDELNSLISDLEDTLEDDRNVVERTRTGEIKINAQSSQQNLFLIGASRYVC